MSRVRRVRFTATVLFSSLLPLSVFAQESAPFVGRLSIEMPTLAASIVPEDGRDADFAPSDSDAVVEGATLESGSLTTEPLTQGALSLTSVSSTLPWRFAELFDEGQEESAPTDLAEEGASILDLPIVRDDKVESHIRFFQIAIRDRFEQWLLRLGHYKPLVENIFTEFNLPSDLVYLSLVESGFNPHAYSRARATGPWQFMKGTARLYGLRVDQYVDERRDPIKSTIAAARYLRDLYDLFGAWPLAMAAYNAGEGKVMRALQKARAESFSEIARTKHLRRETKEYVPRFMAATIIARNPDQYGFVQDAPEPHQFEEVIVQRSVHLKTLAAATGISFYELRRLNPELRLDVTPPDDDNYHLKVPVGHRDAVVQALGTVPTWKPVPVAIKKGKSRGEAARSYRVRVGDTLWTIAKRFNLTVAQLKARNSFAVRGIRPGDLLHIGPAR